ncbi:hypothetical protein GWI34_27770 [Actinomadura sp. DSM 109109]|nr:hypothetical protein [Actinomadura lepetitiana]
MEQVVGNLRIAVAAATASASVLAATVAITRAEEGPGAGLGDGGKTTSGIGSGRPSSAKASPSTTAQLGGSPSPGGRLGPHDRYLIGTFNMGGYNDQLGHRGNEIPEAFVKEVNQHRPAFVAIQEACSDWMNYLDSRLPGYTVAFDPVRASRPGTPPGDPIQKLHQEPRGGGPAQWEDPTGRESQMPKRWMQCKVRSSDPKDSENPEKVRSAPPRAFGNAVLYRNDLGIEGIGAAYGRKGHGLGTDGVFVAEDYASLNIGKHREQREMLCVKSSTRRLVFCSTHLSAGNSERDGILRAREARQARWILRNRLPADHTVLVGGDLNASPTDRPANYFYHAGYGDGAEGDLKEAASLCKNRIAPRFLVKCRSGVQTITGRKIDYLFVSPQVLVKGSSVGPLGDDHRSLWAEVVA